MSLRHQLLTPLVLALPLTAQAAQGYAVTVIADSRSTTFAGWALQGSPSLNESGQVAFTATQSTASGDSSAILIGDGSNFTTVAQGFRPKGGVGPSLSLPAINVHSQVVYNSATGQADGNAVMIWEAGSARVFIDNPIVRPPTQTIFGRGQGGLSDATTVAASSTDARYCIAGAGGAIVSCGPSVVSGEIFPTTDDIGAISHSGDYAVTGGDLRRYVAGQGLVTVGYGLVAFGVNGTRSFQVGTLSGGKPTATATAVSINNLGYASFISNIGGSGSFVGAIDTRSASNTFSSLVTLSNGFTSLGDSNRGSAINNTNEIVFVADPANDGTVNQNVYVTRVGGLSAQAMLQRGDVVTADGAVFWNTRNATPGTHGINDAGQVAIMAQLTRDGGRTTFDALLRIDPLPGSSPGTPVLPTPGASAPGGGFVLQPGRNVGGFVPVPRNRPVFVDPEIAIGYDYAVSAGGPAIEGVLIPTALPHGDEDFVLEFDGHTVALKAGRQYSFTDLVAGGVRQFRLSGINIDEALDPGHGNAFVTGLIFGEGGSDDFSVTMTPLTANVPEPGTWALLLAGLAWVARRRLGA